MKYKVGDIVEIILNPTKGHSQKFPPVIGLIQDIDDSKTNFKKTAYYILLLKSDNQTSVWIELEKYKVKVLTS